jgi:hypothetical protein
MPRFWTSTTPTIRPRSTGRIPVLACLLVFAVTAAVVYRWGCGGWLPVRANPAYSATAYVVQHASQTVAESRLPLACTNTDPRRAEENANGLAERYVQDRRADWRRQTEEPCLKARAAIEQAQRDLAKSEAELDAFRKDVARAAKVSPPAGPTMVDNPAWLDLNSVLTKLERRHEQLLVERTPLHPLVRDVVRQIDDVKKQMVGVPRQIEGKLPANLPETKPTLDPQQQRRLAELTAAVDASRQACEAADTAEKQTLAAQQGGPQYSIVYATAVEILTPGNHDLLRLIGTTLAAGLLMAFGLGFVGAGRTVEPLSGSIAQVQTDSRAPVLGTIPADLPVANVAAVSRHQSRVRQTLIAVGVLLMLAAPAAAILGIAGIRG